MNRKLLRAGTWAAVAVLAVGCGLCTPGRPTRNAEEFVPGTAAGALSVPSLGKLADGAQALVVTARSGAGGAQVVKATADLARTLGFDPLSRDGLRSAGIEPDASFAAGGTVDTGVLALPMADKATLEATIERLARDRAGFATRGSTTVDGVSVTTLSAEGSDVPGLAWTIKDGFALVSNGRNCVASVVAAANRKPEESLAKTGALAAGKAKIGARELYVFVPKESLPQRVRASDAVVVGLGVSGSELAARAFVSLPEAKAKAVASVLVGGGADVLARQPDAAPLHLRLGVDWTALGRAADASASTGDAFSELRAFLKTADVDLDADVLANLEPGFSLSMGLAPSANLSRAFNFDPRRGNPLSNWAVLGLGKVKDAAKAEAVLAKLAPLVAGGGLPVEERTIAGARAWIATAPDGSEGLAWALKGKELVLAGGAAALEAHLGGTVTAALRPDRFEARAKDAMFGTTAGALAVDFAKLGASVNELPSSAFGTGPGALMARSVAKGVIQPLSRLKAVAAVAPAEGGVLVDFAINGK